MHACTIIARNYVAQAQVLVDSFREHHPDGTFHVLLVEDPLGCDRPALRGAEVVLLDEIGIEPDLLGVMAMSYQVIELATAVKPWLLEALLDRGFDHVAYFDPDIVIARPISELPGLAAEHSIVLTPHTVSPMPRDGLTPNEQTILLAGVFNLGFVSVGNTPEARRFLNWWSARLARDCFIEHARGFFVDQRWIDFVPTLFEHHVVKDPSWNVAYWNLATRDVHLDEAGACTVDGLPLTFFHYSGYTPRLPHLLSKHQGPVPRVLLSEEPAVLALCDRYAELLKAAGFESANDGFRTPFSALPDGLPIDDRMRRIVRQEVAWFDAGVVDAVPPSPFVAGGGARFLDWLDQPGQQPHAIPALGRYFADVFVSRPDLQARYPEVRRGDPCEFLDWVELFGLDELDIPRALLERARAGQSPASNAATDIEPGEEIAAVEAVQGVEVAGYLTADLGIGEASRLLVEGIDAAGIPVSTHTYGNTSSRLGTPFDERVLPAGQRHDQLIVCVNADMLPSFAADVGPEYFEGRHVVGLWFWETSIFPDWMQASVDLVDEIWVTSEFTREVIAACTDKPVLHAPLPIRAPADPGSVTVPELGDDDAFTFLFVFDHLSILQRKNPIGLMEAYARAFPEPDGATRLVIKTINGKHKQWDRERLRYLASKRPDVVLIERYLSREELDALMWRADCYASLHRAEGFGLTMAETMAMGKPVIATGYSGNLAFMDDTTGFLVDHEIVEVGPDCEPYPPTAVWAEPDLNHAARLMQMVVGQPDVAAARAARAKAHVADEFSAGALASFATERLAAARSSSEAAASGAGRIRSMLRR